MELAKYNSIAQFDGNSKLPYSIMDGNSNIFMPYVVNIFTDASIVTDKETSKSVCVIGCMILYTNHYNTTFSYPVYYESCATESITIAEASAIIMGLRVAGIIINRDLLQTGIVNIFSDSLDIVSKCKDRIHLQNATKQNSMIPIQNGIYEKRKKKNAVINPILSIAAMYSVPVNIYHIKGHSERLSIKDLSQRFNKFNGIDISDMDIINVSNYNQLVDNTISKISNSILYS